MYFGLLGQNKTENQKETGTEMLQRCMFDYFLSGKIIFHQIASVIKNIIWTDDSSGNMMYYTANGLQQVIPQVWFWILYVNGTDVITFPKVQKSDLLSDISGEIL